MRFKKCLSGILALAMVVQAGAWNVPAAQAQKAADTATQVVSEPETVYVNAYGAKEREVSFNDNWRFYLGELSGAEAAAYNDSAWKHVNLPHDYSIDQGYTTAAPAEQESGYVLGGTGWYRKSFTLSEDLAGKIVSVEFDGVYMNATVYLNGKQLGTHPNGYAPFAFTLPGEELRYGNEENVLAVKVDHKQPSSRWYSGSGIYRDVTLTVTDPVHVAYHGTTVTTPDIENGTGTVQVAADIENNSAAEASVSVRQVVYEAGGKEPVATGDTTQAQVIAAGQKAKITGTATVASPKLWTTDTPNLYTVRTEVYVGNTLTDAYESDFGFRWATFTKDNGFFLNGKNIKLRGVCMHHDQGGLGSEAWYRSVERQVEKLKEMGANTIRVTHNPASSALIDICNRKGMMLVEEAFDAWLSNKAGNTEGVGSAKAAKTETPTGGYQNYTSGTGCFDSGKASGHTSLYATFSVKYEEGRLEAKAFEADGVTEITDIDGRSFVETAQAASKLNIKADRKEITADGTDLSYLTIDVTDADGRFVNGAEPEVTVSVEGAGKLLALDNGVQNDVTSHSEPTRKAGKGKLLAIVQSTDQAGSFTVTAKAPGYPNVKETVTTVAAGEGP